LKQETNSLSQDFISFSVDYPWKWKKLRFPRNKTGTVVEAGEDLFPIGQNSK
jgi:hypothetical protein